MSTEENPCSFCLTGESRGISIELFKELYSENQIIDIQGLLSSYIVLQDLIPLGIHGAHLLLLAKANGKSHDISLASVENQKEMLLATQLLIRVMKLCFPKHPLLVFEHGPGFVNGEPIACGGCHVDHAHGHLLALPRGVDLTAIVDDVEKTLSASGWSDLSNQKFYSSEILGELPAIAGINPYMHFGLVNSDDETSALTYVQTSRDQHVESQLIRRVIAKVVYGQTRATYWNWRDVSDGLTSKQRMQELRQSVADFRSIYESILSVR